MSNTSSTSMVSVSSIVRAPAFRQGFDHYCKGVAPIFDEPHKVAGRGRQNTMWSYEMGRLFAAFLSSEGVQLKSSEFFRERRLTWEVRELASKAFWAGVFR